MQGDDLEEGREGGKEVQESLSHTDTAMAGLPAGCRHEDEFRILEPGVTQM